MILESLRLFTFRSLSIAAELFRGQLILFRFTARGERRLGFFGV
jgi:hypothetical protein